MSRKYFRRKLRVLLQVEKESLLKETNYSFAVRTDAEVFGMLLYACKTNVITTSEYQNIREYFTFLFTKIERGLKK